MISGSNASLSRRLTTAVVRLSVMMAMMLTVTSAAGTLKLGDILVIEPSISRISVLDPITGAKTLISQGGLLGPVHKTVGVALARDGDIIAVHRLTGLIRVNPVTGDQSILSQGGHFRDPWAIAIDEDTGYIYIADSGYDFDRPEINQAGKIIRVDPLSGAQVVIASGSPCNVFPANVACQNTTTAGSYLTHPYGIAIDRTVPGTIVVADMSSFNGKGAIIRIAVPSGTQTLLWGPASAVPAPRVAQVSPLGCPMGVAVEPNGNILTTVFTYLVPAVPVFPPPAATFYGCAPPGVFRLDLFNRVQSVVNSNAPPWQPNRSYAIGDVIRDATSSPGHIHRVVTAGVSQGSTPPWNSTLDGATIDGAVVWRNIGLGANWLIPFGLDVEPAPTPSDPSAYNIIVPDEGHGAVFRLNANGAFTPSSAPLSNDTSAVTHIDVITFTPPGGFKTEPARSNGQPQGALAPGATQTTLSLTTAQNATCRYSSVAGVPYASMTNSFTTTGSTSHSTLVSGLTNPNSYTFYVRCVDGGGSANTNDFLISFDVPTPPLALPVAAYGFDEGSGTTVADASGRGNTGAVEGASWIAAGRFGKALSFDGVDDWVTVNSAPLLNLTTGMTLEAWVFPTALGSPWRAVMTKERTDGEVYNLYAHTSLGGPVVYVVRSATPDAPSDALGVASLPLNTWSHVTATYDNATLRLYVNGAQVGTRQITGSLTISSGALRIGGNSIWGEFFQGRIDEVRLYNRAITPAEILSDMNTPVDGSVPDTMPPFRVNGQPAGTLPSSTIQASLSLTTHENAICRYSPVAGVAYGSMTQTFTTTGSTAHATTVNGLTAGVGYTFHVRCVDGVSNANPDDFSISFSVAGPLTALSSFPGTENPLSEGGVWDSPGAWADLQKNSGAFAVGLNAHARRVTPTVSANQYSEITYSQDPGSSSWVGVTTRVQGAGDGSGYLAIAYAGGVQLYRADDTGSLNFTLLASASVGIGTAPRRLRLESQGATHRVYFNGTQVISHNASGIVYNSGQPGIAASVFGGPQVKILSFEGGNIGAASPTRFNGQPTGKLSSSTTQATLSLTTDQNATCRYSPLAGVAYASMTQTFTTTGATSHATTVNGLTTGTSYNFRVRCMNTAGNANTDDFVITFSVAGLFTAVSTFSGAESPLFESGLWDSPGAWGDLQKNSGAFTTGLNAQARLVTPTIAADQYSEITYSQDPGSSSWVGVTTRVQGPGNGSGYLAIVYAGAIHLYRADDSGSLNFTLLATATVGVGASPRRLRLESQGSTHRVYFNGTQVISHNATGTVYSSGQPGIAASVFGGPQVKILSFEGGNIGN